jgi:hypothetical protein
MTRHLFLSFIPRYLGAFPFLAGIYKAVPCGSGIVTSEHAPDLLPISTVTSLLGLRLPIPQLPRILGMRIDSTSLSSRFGIVI